MTKLVVEIDLSADLFNNEDERGYVSKILFSVAKDYNYAAKMNLCEPTRQVQNFVLRDPATGKIVGKTERREE